MEIKQSSVFAAWLSGIKERTVQERIAARVLRLAGGNPGDHKSVGGGVMEMRLDFGPGYRVYYANRGPIVILLLCGGDKKSQQRDVATAQGIAAEWED